MSGTTVKLTDNAVKVIEATLSKGQRVELIPTKDGVRVIHVKREQINTFLPPNN